MTARHDRTRALVAAVVLTGVLAACGSTADPPTATADPPAAAAPSTTTTTAASTTSTTSAADAVAAGECPALPAAAAPDPDRPRYEATAEVDPEAGTVDGSLRIEFTPDLDVDVLVLRLWPNSPRPADDGVVLEVGELTEAGGGVLPTERPDPTTLVVDLPGGLAAGETVEVAMPYELTVPGPVPDRVSRSAGSLRLGSFLPLLAWEPGVGWAREPAVDQFAEAATSPTADYEVAIAVPDGYDVLATGTPDGDGTWRAEAVRDFAATVGRFRLAQATVDLPDPVRVTVGVHDGVAEDPAAFLARVRDSLAYFALRFGPYPWDDFTLAITPDLRGGIEFPTHVMQGPDTVGRTTPHEVAHQWFYALVGNDQGRDPVLDEGLASYGEARFETAFGLWRTWALPADGEGRAGEPMTYWADRQGSYYRSVYVQGALALASLGDAGFVDCVLRHYVATNRYRVATVADLVEAAEVVWPDAADRLAAYGIVG